MYYFKTLKSTEENAQHTIAESFTFSGIGLHTGTECTVTLFPAKENTGIILQNDKNESVSLLDARISDTQLGTSVSSEKFEIATIEHLLSALFGTGIDNIIIQFHGEEIPILDGSSLPFVEMIKKAGVKKQDASRVYIAFTENMEFVDGDKYLRITPSDRCFVDLTIDFPDPVIGIQNLSLEINQENYETLIAPARTFCREQDVKEIKHLGLGKGGGKENAIIVSNDKILNEDGFRIDREFAAHKILDFLGDFYLTGYRFLGDINAYKTGHTLNSQLTKDISKRMYEHKRVS